MHYEFATENLNYFDRSINMWMYGKSYEHSKAKIYSHKSSTSLAGTISEVFVSISYAIIVYYQVGIRHWIWYLKIIPIHWRVVTIDSSKPLLRGEICRFFRSCEIRLVTHQLKYLLFLSFSDIMNRPNSPKFL